MGTYVALVRGIKAGRSTRIAMADLRRAVESLGHTSVRTYANSGNVVFEVRPGDGTDDVTLGRDIEAAVAEVTGLSPRVLVRSADELAATAGANPFPDEPDPKKVHAVFLPDVPSADVRRRASAAQAEAAERGSRDRVELVGRVAYLHTPDGLGRSVLADLLGRGATGSGTARNWSTVTKLLQVCRDAP